MQTNRLLIKAVLVIALLVSSELSLAETITAKRTFAACTTETLASKMYAYEDAKDQKGVSSLISSGQCMAVSAGESVTITRPGILIATIEYQGRKLFARADALR